jgi:hypothetical membrane protein
MPIVASQSWHANRGLLARIVIGAVALYVAVDVVLVFLRPEFSVLHNAESDYGSKGHYAWLMDLNFLLRGALSLAAARALSLSFPTSARMRGALVALNVWAACSALLAFFPDDPLGTKTHGAGKVHLLLAGIAFIAVLIGTLGATRRLRQVPSWRPAQRTLTVLSILALVPLLLLLHAGFHHHSLGGLYEKLFLAVELAWICVAAAFISRRQPDGGNAAAPAAT